MTNVKIIGAGSIGNHLANAARSKNWNVIMCDIDTAALKRTKEEIYPMRYGKWDDSISLYSCNDVPKGDYDWIFIGTPPDSHMNLALEALQEKPKGILVEKPFATPDLSGCQELYELAIKENISVFVGYDHVVAESIPYFIKSTSAIGEILTLDVSFREHWQGIFNAHPWLEGPSDTYLGYWKKGGGACGEHSHALNLWQHFAHEIGAGRVTEVSACLDYVSDGKVEYDRLALLNLKTETGLVGRVVQDVVTKPSLKSARIQGVDSGVEWQCCVSPYSDIVTEIGKDEKEKVFEKNRPADFIQELNHLEANLGNSNKSPISIVRGLDSMLVIAAAHLSAKSGSVVEIDYSKGYINEALILK